MRATNLREAIAKVADAIRVGNGLDKDVQMGPVITAESKTRIEGLIAKGVREGAKVLLDGRTRKRLGIGGEWQFPEADDSGWRAGRQRAFDTRRFSGRC